MAQRKKTGTGAFGASPPCCKRLGALISRELAPEGNCMQLRHIFSVLFGKLLARDPRGEFA